MKTVTILTALTLLFLTSCTTLSPEHIRGHQWLYGQGYRIGDQLQFDNKTFSFNEDTIMKSNLPIAVVVMSSGDLLGNNNDITIQSLATGEEGLYHEKWSWNVKRERTRDAFINPINYFNPINQPLVNLLTDQLVNLQIQSLFTLINPLTC